MDRKNNKKYVLYAHGGSSNHGCEAIVRATKKIADNGDIALISYRPDDDKKYGLDQLCEVLPNTDNNMSDLSIGKLLRSLYKRLTGDRKPHTKFCFSNLFSVAKDGDIALSIGGDNYCSSFYKQLSDLNFLLNKQSIKTVLWGCSIEPELLNIKEAQNDLKRYSLITARDTITYNALINAGINKNTHLFSDPAFTLDTIKLDLPDGFVDGNTIGLNVSPLIQRLENGENITLKNYQALIQYIIDNTDFQIALIPHVVWHVNNDLEPLTLLFNQFKETGRVILLDDHNCMEMKGFIARCRMFIGARTHATIAAYSSYVPTLVLGYSVKANGIAKDIFGTYENYVKTVQSLKNEDDMINAFKWLMQNENDIRKHLQNFMPDYINKAYLAGDELKKLEN